MLTFPRLASTVTFDCLVCATQLEFIAGSLSTHCPTCEDERPLPRKIPKAIDEMPIRGAGPGTDEIEGRAVEECSGCGALVSGPAALGRCPLCQAATTAIDEPPHVLRPHGVLRRLVDERTARTFVERELRRTGRGDEVPPLHAVYLPWLFYSCRVRATYEGRRGEIQDSLDDHARMTWIEVSGAIDREWVDRGACGSRGLAAHLVGSTEDWDWPFCEPYATSAVTDAAAEHCARPLEDVASAVVWDFDGAVADEIRTDIGGDEQDVRSAQSNRTNERARVILVPVWVGRLGNERGPHVVVNGRTAKTAIAGGSRRLPPSGEVSMRTGMVVAAVTVAILGGVLVWAALG